ncbi:MAG: hypothetical protein IK090_04625, partial [Clostridia bacterium]|nr:hypothetical protein [Clostridia bacterium]
MADQKNVVKANTVTGDFNLVGNIIHISGMDEKAVEGLLAYFKKAFEGYLQKSAKSSETVDAIAVSQRALYEIVLRQENRQKQDKDALQEALRAEIDSAADRLSKQLEQAGGDVGLLSRNLDYTIKERLEKLSEENAKILSRLDLDKNKKRLN